MKTHVDVVGLINIISGALGALTGVIMFAVLFFLAPVADDPVGSPIMVLMAFLIGGLLLLFALPSVIAGVGLLQHKPWARILALIVGVLSLFNFPIGTIIGAYTIVVLTNDEAVKSFGTPA